MITNAAAAPRATPLLLPCMCCPQPIADHGNEVGILRLITAVCYRPLHVAPAHHCCSPPEPLLHAVVRAFLVFAAGVIISRNFGEALFVS